MNDGKDNKGFSGLSSLASDLHEITADSTRRNVQWEKRLAPGGNKHEQQPHPRESAAKRRSGPGTPQPSELEPEVVVSGTSRTPASASSRGKWFWGLAGIGVLIWFFNELMLWCETEGVDYVFGLAQNPRLKQPIATAMEAVRQRRQASGKAEREFQELRYQTLDTWTRERRWWRRWSTCPGERTRDSS